LGFVNWTYKKTYRKHLKLNNAKSPTMTSTWAIPQHLRRNHQYNLQRISLQSVRENPKQKTRF